MANYILSSGTQIPALTISGQNKILSVDTNLSDLKTEATTYSTGSIINTSNNTNYTITLPTHSSTIVVGDNRNAPYTIATNGQYNFPQNHSLMPWYTSYKPFICHLWDGSETSAWIIERATEIRTPSQSVTLTLSASGNYTASISFPYKIVSDFRMVTIGVNINFKFSSSGTTILFSSPSKSVATISYATRELVALTLPPRICTLISTNVGSQSTWSLRNNSGSKLYLKAGSLTVVGNSTTTISYAAAQILSGESVTLGTTGMGNASGTLFLSPLNVSVTGDYYSVGVSSSTVASVWSQIGK